MNIINKIKTKKKAFTLVELIISIGILTFVIGASYSLINSSSRLVTRQVNATNAQNNIRTAVDWISKDLQEGETFNSVLGENVLYSIEKEGSEVKYIREESGNIGNGKVYKITRKSNNENFVLLENIPEEGFKIEKQGNLYHVIIIIKDKLNKDKKTEFDVNSKINLAVVDKPDEGEESDGNPNEPYIDIDNNDKLDGKDYNVSFINGVYDWQKDEKYVKGNLVFPSDFIVKGGSTLTCIAKEGIKVDKNVTLGTEKGGSINLITKDVIADNAIISTDAQGNKGGKIDIKTSGVLSFKHGKLEATGQGSGDAGGNITIDARGSVDGSYCEITCHGGGGGIGEVKILSSSSIMIAYSKLICTSNGNGDSLIDIKANGNINCNYSNLSANKNGNSNSNIKISSVGGTDKSFVKEEGNGAISIK